MIIQRLSMSLLYAVAQNNLGIMYEFGQGIRQDYIQAHMWFSLAASRFPPGEDRDRAVQDRDRVAALMTPAQITEAEKLAREWPQREWRPRGTSPSEREASRLSGRIGAGNVGFSSSRARGCVSAAAAFHLLHVATNAKAADHLHEAVVVEAEPAEKTADPV